MSKLKRTLATLLAVCMMVGTTACGGGGDTPQETADSTGGGTAAETGTEAPEQTSGDGETLQLWHIHTGEARKNALQDAVDRFTAETGIDVEVTVLENDPYKTKLRTVMGSGDAPDVFHSWGGGWLKSFVDEGLVMDISEPIQGWVDEINQPAVGMGTFDGKVWGSPYIISSTPLFYNTAIFEEYDLEVPTTWEEMETVCDTLIDNGIIPFALANLSKWPGAQHFVLLSMRIGGPDIFERAINGEVAFDDDVFIQAGTMLQEMVDKGWFPEGANALNWDTGDSRQMFYAGQCAMIVQTSGFGSTALSENEDFALNNLGIASYPTVPGGEGKTTDLLAGVNSFSISSSSTKQDAALQLIEFLSTDDTLQSDFAEFGTMGAKLGTEGNNAIFEQCMSQISNATYLQNFIDQTLSPELAEKHKDTCQALYGKTMTPEEAAEAMQALYEQENAG